MAIVCTHILLGVQSMCICTSIWIVSHFLHIYRYWIAIFIFHVKHIPSLLVSTLSTFSHLYSYGLTSVICQTETISSLNRHTISELLSFNITFNYLTQNIPAVHTHESVKFIYLREKIYAKSTIGGRRYSETGSDLYAL